MKRLLAACFLLSAICLRADTADTIPFRATLRAANETTAVADAGAIGSVTVWLHVVRDSNGSLTSGSLDFSVNYKFTKAVTITAMHIHKAPAGVAGGIVIPVPLTRFDDATGVGSIPTRQVQFSNTDTSTAVLDAVNGMLADPSQYYFNVHTADSPAGAMRGQMEQAEMAVLIGQMSPLNETPQPIQNSTASAIGSVIAIRTRDKNLALTSGMVIFDVNYTGFPADTNFTGMHLHFGAAGVSGPVTIDSTLKGPLASGGTSGNLHFEVEVDLTRNLAPETLNALFDNPGAAYINVHTQVSPGGAARAQLRRTDHEVIQVTMTPQEEVTASPSNLAASATSAVHLYTIRNADGSVADGVVIFDENPRFPSGTTFTATHIHDQVAGQNGPVTIDSRLSSSPLLVADGVGNIFRIVYVNSGQALTSLNDLIRSPERHYLNLHTSQFPAGAVRGQLGGPKPAPVITSISAAAAGTSRIIAANNSLMAVFGTNLAPMLGTLDGFPALDKVPAALNGISAAIGGIAAPIIVVAPDHLIVQVPSELTPGGYHMTVTNSNGTSNVFVVNIQAIYPSIFFDSIGGVVVKLPSYALVRPETPAGAGDVLVVYLTGLGQTNPPLATGQIAARNPLSFTGTPIVTIGGKPANLLHSLAVPGFVGLYQIAVVMPAGIPAGNTTLQVSLSGNDSNTVNIAAK